MKHIAGLTMLAGLVTSANALALGSIADITLIDRDSGAALNTYYYQGDYWVAGKPGARYAIEIRNCIGGRLLAVTSVDGVNVISGATAGWDQTGYVFEPGQRYQITGWRKSNAEVAAFVFTDSPNSYAERTGRPANVGVIGVALFRERPPPARDRTPELAPFSYQAPAAPRPADADVPAAAQSAAAAGRAAAGLAANEAHVMPAPGPPLPAAKLGTGHGEREYSYAEDTEFRRMQREPNEVIRIRYDSFDNLVAMGIVRAPLVTPPTPDPFPRSRRQFVPDPPG
jgi:hypothetical protein